MKVSLFPFAVGVKHADNYRTICYNTTRRIHIVLYIMKARQIVLKKYDPIPFRSDMLYRFYILKNIVKTRNVKFNTIFDHFSLLAIQSLPQDIKQLWNLSQSQRQLFAQGFIISLLIGHCIALIVYLGLSIQASTYVHAHPLQSSISQQGFLLWSGFFLFLMRIIEITGLIFRQTWGWFLAQFTYVSVLPYLLFISIISPTPRLVFDTVIYLVVTTILYLPPVRTIFFPAQSSFISFFSITMVLNGVFLLFIEIGKTML